MSDYERGIGDAAKRAEATMRTLDEAGQPLLAMGARAVYVAVCYMLDEHRRLLLGLDKGD